MLQGSVQGVPTTLGGKQQCSCNFLAMHFVIASIMKRSLILLCCLITLSLNAQDKTGKIEVMVLGTFHFSYPNLDVIKTDKADQVDVMSTKRQLEIEALVNALKKFRPTKIAIEVKTDAQPRIDKEYASYLNDSFPLPKDEQYQVGFRLAKQLGLPKLYCIDAWGNIDYFFTTKDQVNYEVREERIPQLNGYDALEDSLVKAGALEHQSLQKKMPAHQQTLTQILASINTPANLEQDHSGYFGKRFLYEAEPFDYTGTDWVALTWYSRNLRIFRNILRMDASPADRILVIYGSGHAYLLNQFLNESLTHQALSPMPYLTK